MKKRFQDRIRSNPPHNPPAPLRHGAAKPAQARRKASAAGANHTQNGVRLFGLHAVREALLNPQRAVLALLVTEAGLEALSETLVARQKLGLSKLSPKIADRTQLDRMAAGGVHQGIVLETDALPELDVDDLLRCEHLPELLLILDQVSDPHNVGAILRSAAAFGAGGLIVTERHAPHETGVLAKAASGALEHVPLLRAGNLARAMETLKKAGYWIYGLAEEGEQTPAAIDLQGKIALVLGAEGSGLRRLTRTHCHGLIRLPTSGPIAALNVSNAAAIMLYEVQRQRDHQSP